MLTTSVAADWPLQLRNGIQPEAIIFDARFAAARVFAVQAARRGVATLAIAGDVTSLWLERLHPRWSQSGVIADGELMAGLTTHQTLLCLEQLAHDSWRRVLSCSRHPSWRADDVATQLTHWIIGRPP